MKTYHVLALTGSFLASGSPNNPKWVDSVCEARLFDLEQPREALAAELLCAQLGGRMFPVEVRVKSKEVPYPRWNQNKVILDFISDFEKSHFRSETDTGANPSAMMLWNMVRFRAGLEGITEDDLPKYDGVTTKYVLPKGSKLIGFNQK